MKKIMQAGKFKAECLKVMDQVCSSGTSLTITKRHVPIVKICPINKAEVSLFGRMKGTLQIKSDLIEPTGESWDAEH